MISHARHFAALVVFLGLIETASAAEPLIAFEQSAGEVLIKAGEQPVARYVFRDARIPRPFFDRVSTLDGVQVTRNNPPREGDASDHADFHPGIWLAFGVLGDGDFWRNKARVEHVGFTDSPKVTGSGGSFTVRNRYFGPKGRICDERCRYSFHLRPGGYLIIADSAFSSEHPFHFGDQEEMGLGIRLATPLRVKGGGGTIRNGDGGVNEKDVWGKQSNWCDYSGKIDGKAAGMTLMPDPANFRRCWYHARDYGFVAANPFGRKAFTRGEESRVEVKSGETFRLRFAVWVHGQSDIAAAHRDALKIMRTEPRP